METFDEMQNIIMGVNSRNVSLSIATLIAKFALNNTHNCTTNTDIYSSYSDKVN